MTEKEKKFLSDIKNAINFIEQFTMDCTSYDKYIIDYKTKSAVERQLAIIGEAINRFLKANDNNKLENAIKIISLRNRIIHTYDNIDDSIIWTIVTRYLQPLKEEVSTLINS